MHDLYLDPEPHWSEIEPNWDSVHDRVEEQKRQEAEDEKADGLGGHPEIDWGKAVTDGEDMTNPETSGKACVNCVNGITVPCQVGCTSADSCCDKPLGVPCYCALGVSPAGNETT